MYITVEMLKKHNACQEQVDLFEATFPDGVQVTEAVCLAVADKFDFAWAADNLLPKVARAEYQAKHEPIWAEYKAKLAPIRAEYEAKHMPIWAEYLAEYKATHMPIWAEYLAKRAALFGRIAETI